MTEVFNVESSHITVETICSCESIIVVNESNKINLEVINQLKRMFNSQSEYNKHLLVLWTLREFAHNNLEEFCPHDSPNYLAFNTLNKLINCIIANQDAFCIFKDTYNV